jgi:hypothetical protein
MKEFKKEDLEFYLPDTFKGLSKDYLLECIFNDEIQKKRLLKARKLGLNANPHLRKTNVSNSFLLWGTEAHL